eukprot:4117199-Pyramimonas_sp.AAC.1
MAPCDRALTTARVWACVGACVSSACSFLFVMVPPTHADSGMFRMPLLDPLYQALHKKKTDSTVEGLDWNVNPVAMEDSREARDSETFSDSEH